MNNKLMSYEEAVEKLKILELNQRYAKIRRNGHLDLGFDESKSAKEVHKLKLEINKILTIIHLHKQSRKLWAKNNLEVKYGYMCKVDFDHEVGEALGGNKIYPSLKDLRRHHSECHFGSVKVKVSLEEVIREEDVTGMSCE